MTISTTTSRVAYAGNGATTEFSIPFLFLANAHIVVTLRDSDGDETTWVENTQYTLTGAGVAAGGTLTVDTSPTDYTPETGETLVIRRVVPQTQATDYPEGGTFPASAHETALDKLTMLVQQLAEELGRALQFPVTDSSSLDNEIPNSATRASMLLGFDADGDVIIVDPDSVAAGDTIVTAFMATVLDDANAAAARTTLGAAGSGLATASGLTQNTARLLGRTTASAGAVEEISVSGTGLSLSGGALASVPASDTVAGDIEIAIQSEMEAGSDTARAVTPGRQHFHPSAAKVWGRIERGSGAPVLDSPDYNIASVTDDGAGNTIVTIDIDFSTDIYAAGASPVTAGTLSFTAVHSHAVGSFEIQENDADGTPSDTIDVSCWAFGDHA